MRIRIATIIQNYVEFIISQIVKNIIEILGITSQKLPKKIPCGGRRRILILGDEFWADENKNACNPILEIFIIAHMEDIGTNH